MTVPALAQRRTTAEAGTTAAAGAWRENLTGWAFAAPFVILFGLFMALPIAASFVLSFTDFGLRDLANPLGTTFVGLENYLDLLSDGTFWTSLFNTFYFVVIGVPVTLA